MFAQVVLFICLASFISAIPLDYHGSYDYGHIAAPIQAAPAISIAAAAPIVHAPSAVIQAAPAVIQAAPAIAVKAEPYDPNPQYSYKYGVSDHHTGDSKHAEETLVNGIVHGSYSLAEPDGTIRKVTYTADKINGFNAVVEKHGKAIHAVPAIVAQPAPAVIAHSSAAYAPSVGYHGYHGSH